MSIYIKKWSRRKTYDVGDRVKYGRKVYISRLYKNNNKPTEYGWVVWRRGGGVDG